MSSIPFSNHEPGENELVEMYERLARVRAVDEALRKAIMTGRAPTFYFPVTGHEAIAAALHQVRRRSDYFVAYYRGLHHHLSTGLTAAEIIGEMLGKSTGCVGGKGGQMHMVSPEAGLMMTTGIVGGGIAPAVGLALSSRIRKDGRVTVVAFGDGAVQNGYFHEAANMAAKWDLPLVMLCENNRIAETVPTDVTLKGRLTDRAGAHSIPAEVVDGYDPIALYGVLSRAFDRARSGFGATFIEAECFRYHGHFLGDPMPAVSRARLETEMARDPFTTYRQRLVDEHRVEESVLDDIKAQADRMAEEAIDSALDAEAPPAASIFDHVYANPVEP